MNRVRLAIAVASLLPCLSMLPVQAQAPAASADVAAQPGAKPDASFAAARRRHLGQGEEDLRAPGPGGSQLLPGEHLHRYVGWPPGIPKPSNLDTLRKSSAGFNRKNSEKLELTFTDFTLRDSTAVIYYQTHRTMLPNGTPVDERFDTIHVWVREGADWKLIGAMARPRT